MLVSCADRSAARSSRPAETSAPAADKPRHEVEALLAEIRSRTPSPAEIIGVVRNAAGGELSARRLEQIAQDIRALYGWR
jgi:hypothetical protein